MDTQLATQRLADRGEGVEVRLPARYVRFGAFQFDAQRQDLTKNGARLRVPGKVCQVLMTLLERPGEIVTREELRARLWDSATHVNYDANVNTTVNKLRQILGDSNDDSVYVQTIPRKGYSFVGRLEFVEEAAIRSEAPTTGSVEESSAFWGVAAASQLIGSNRAGVWFAAGVISLVIAAMLFGAAVTLFSYYHS